MLRKLFLDRSATTAAEFAMILPVALLLLFGVIDVGMYSWELNKYEKATQMGTRFAVVTNVISPALMTEDYTDGSYSCDGAVLTSGDRICSESLGTITCTSAGCSCTGTCPSGTMSPGSTDDFDAIVARMHQFQPQIPANAVAVEYRGSGLGYAGDPRKPEIAPIVTVRVNNIGYSPIVLSPFGGTVDLPDFSYSLTLEDGEGAESS